jgi:DNA-binding MarR family transcriptional regulator
MVGTPFVARSISRECLAVRLRLLHRVVNTIYDDALRPHRLKVSQMNLLAEIAANPGTSAAELGRRLRIEKSTLSRDVARLEAKGWVEGEAGEDGRTRALALSRRGLDLLERAAPAWRAAQRRASELLGRRGVEALHSLADGLESTKGR